MSKTTQNLLKKYTKMTGDRKIQIAMQLSESVRKVREAGAIATKTTDKQWKLTNKTFSYR